MTRETDALNRLAREFCVLTSYVDWKAEPRRADPDVLVRVLGLLGAEIDRISDAPAALDAYRRASSQLLVPPCTVAWNGEDAVLNVRLPAAQSGLYSIELILESGQVRHYDGSLDNVRPQRTAIVGDETFVIRPISVPIPAHGYHQITVQTAGRFGRCMVIAAPRRGFAVTEDKRWGVFAPLYGLYSRFSSGTGDLADLAKLARRSGELGASFVGTLPLLSSYLDEPFEYSPYSPVSRLFWNELYLDPTTAPGFDACAAARRAVRSPEYARESRMLREMPLIDYRRQASQRRAVLEALAETAWQSSELRAAIQAYTERHPQAEEYARFRAKTEARRIVWTQWPDAHKRSIADSDYDERARQYHLYAQFAMDAELALLDRSSDVALYLDLPVGVNQCGYDTWHERDCFIMEASVGAPPDALFLAGQNWGLSPLHPQRLREAGYEHFVRCVQTHAEHAGLLRIDHVMGLHRLYWIPEGVSAKDGLYVEYRAPEMYAILCLESTRHKCAIIGENLGTVPDYLPETMRDHGFFGLYVGQFGMNSELADEADTDENDAHDKEADKLAQEADDDHGANVPHDVVVSLNTHDMPTFAGFWLGRDIDDRVKLGLISDEQAEQERKQRSESRRRTAIFLAERGFLDSSYASGGDLFAMMRAISIYLASSDARMALVNLEDIWLEPEPQNVPGTLGPDWPNWCRRLRHDVDNFTVDARVLEVLRAIDRACLQ
ncbi:MAG: 4-alpha-glucanotransferase [Proteobacteria bacterium]|nr:4-alpha-glucanotransferase [Pseudomonadota bacterium]